MMRSLDIGATGMLAQQMNVEVLSNNIANMTTPGFKRSRVEFQDLLYQTVTRPGTQSADNGDTIPNGLQLGLGVRPVATYRIFEQGSMRVTENSLDLAINGNGFFQIELPNGDIGYTRNGSFGIDQDGRVVNQQGYPLQPVITIPTDAIAIEINASGEVLVQLRGEPDLQNIGQLELASFINPSGLEAVGENLYLETTGSGAPLLGNPGEDQYGAIQQGALEESNVNSVEEISELITAQRAYEMNSNVISTSDEMLGTVSDLR